MKKENQKYDIGRAKIIGWGIVTAVLLTTANLSAEIVLGSGNVNGKVSLSQDTYASGIVYFSDITTSTGYVVDINSSGGFNLDVLPESTFQIEASLSNFQGMDGTSLSIRKNNLGPVGEGNTLFVDLEMDSGRIHPSVTNLSGVKSLSFTASSGNGSDETYYSRVASTTSLDLMLMPIPTITGIVVNGWANVDVTNATGSCNADIPLLSKTIAVETGITTDVEWTVDTGNIDCAHGTLEGNLTITGTPTPYNQTLWIYVERRYQGYASINNGSYKKEGLSLGSGYIEYGARYYSGPYKSTDNTSITTSINDRSKTFQIKAGETTFFNIDYEFGTFHSDLKFNGAWDLNDVSKVHAGFYKSRYNGIGNVGLKDDIDMNTGRFDFIGPSTTYTSGQLRFIDVHTDENGVEYASSFTYWPDNNIEAEIVSGTNTEAPQIEVSTSETLMSFSLSGALSEDKIKKIVYSGNSQKSYLRGPGLPGIYAPQITIPEALQSNTFIAKFKGFPGTYIINATAHTVNEQTAISTFTMTLSEPVAVEVQLDAPEETFVAPSGETIGTLDFGKITQSGSTTFTELSSGPDILQEGFKLYVPDSGTAQFFDISTSAEFDGNVSVCVDYNDTGMTLQEEQDLVLAHYVDDNWTDITIAPYPDTTANKICGSTDSFSFFALLQSVILDQDDDGVLDDVDNCPVDANPNQLDTDGNGHGDVCDADIDGDGVVNSSDNCPVVINPLQLDFDGDQLGNVCDADIDGDSVDNDVDNCPVNSNNDQFDFDGDTLGDVCDADDDDDGVTDSQDQCAGTSLNEVVPYVEGEDAGCTSQQLFSLHCSVDGDYRNHGDYIGCVSAEAKRQVNRDILTPDEKGPIVSMAANSDVGKKEK